MTTPNFTPDWNTTDVYVSRDGTEWRFVEDDDGATYPILLASMKNDEQYWFTRDGRYVFAIECHQRDIVKQVPNGDFHAFARAQSEWSQATFGTDLLRGPIGPLKHLAKEAAEAQENPTDVMEFADCLFLTLDASRRAGFSSEALLRAAWEKLTINKAREWPKVTDANAAVEHVREATPAPAASDAGEVQATPKWPRYFQPIGLYQNIYRLKYDSPTSPCKWADGGSDELPHMLTYVADAERDLNYIETDANGNALTQPIEQQQASGVEAKVDEVVTLAQDAAFARRDKSLFMVKEGSKFVPADRFIEAEAELASIKREYLEDASTNRQRIDDHEVLIARLRRRLAARDATIAELTKSGEQASSIRDGALAVCKNSHELVLGLINERNGLKKQLTAADHDAAMKVKDAEIERLKCKWRVDSYEADVQNARADHMQKRAEAAEAEVKRLQDALDENWVTHQQIINARTVRNGEYDTLHAMLVAEQQEHGRTGVERNEYAESCKHWRERAEAAEAKCAAAYRERDDILARKGEAQGERSREVKNLTAQLAAANERVAALRAENERLRALLLKARPYIKQPHDVSKPWVVNEIDQALAQPSAEVGE